MDSVFCKWFAAVCSTGKPKIGPMAINKAESFFDDMKIHDIPVRTSVGTGTV
jgi:hypothetical protein